MGKRINIENQIFSNWLVLHRTTGSNYKCECVACGYIEELNSYKLRNNIIKRCPKCYSISKGYEQRENLENTQINDWFIKEYIGNGKYVCTCKCGNTEELYVYQLKNNRKLRCKECDVKIKEEEVREKLEGLIINGSIVRRYIDNTIYECECSCGRLFKAKAYNIKKQEIYGCEQCLTKTAKSDIKTTLNNICDNLNDTVIQNKLENWQLEILNNKEELEEFINYSNLELKNESAYYELANRLGINCELFLCYLRHYNILFNTIGVNKKEIELRNILIGPIVEYNNKDLINPMEIDIYFKNEKIGVEFNSNYWHSNLFKDKKYHQNKTILAAQNKVQIIHIYEYEWDNKEKQEKLIKFLKNRLGITPKLNVYARKTKLVKLDSKEERRFLEENHLQGYSSSTMCYGLEYNNELIALMSFGRPRFNSGYQWELVRLAYKEGVKVIGGTEKMFKAFLNEFEPDNIISYCDIAKFNGGVYKRLGFSATPKDLTPPNYMWVNPVKNEALPRYKTMKHKLIKQGYGTEEQTEDEIMKSLGYLKIYDCGNLRFIWRKE